MQTDTVMSSKNDSEITTEQPELEFLSMTLKIIQLILFTSKQLQLLLGLRMKTELSSHQVSEAQVQRRNSNNRLVQVLRKNWSNLQRYQMLLMDMINPLIDRLDH